MDLDEIMARYNPWWEGSFGSPGIKRKSYIKEVERKLEQRRMVLIYGLRRVGKTYIMKQFIGEMLKDIAPENIFYISMDHPAVEDVSLQDLLDDYRKRFMLSRDEKVYVLLDEVQKREDFEKELKSIYDLEDNVYLIGAGSNSLMIKHKSGALTGRHARVQVEPLSFEEYLEFRDISVKPSEMFIEEKAFEEYMSLGGMPEYVLTEDPEYIEDMIEDIIYKDIVSRYKVKDPLLLKKLFFLLCERVGKRVTSSKLARVLKLSHDTVTSYLNYFKETYLIDLVEKKGTLNERTYAPKKAYICDVGVLNVMRGKVEKGALAENLAYQKLKKFGTPRYIMENSNEIDFFVDGKAYEVKFKEDITADDVDNLVSIEADDVKDRVMIVKNGASLDVEGIKIISLRDFIKR
ncbi:MAG: ATP-binding protein [Candidatus Natronoplasma sp.]